MSGKSLSNGTLSLRFMQNAQRAKQQAAVELQQAKVKDEAEWEVSKEMRDAWGLTSRDNKSEKTVTYEASYLPFLFPSSSQDGDQGLSSEQNIAGPSQARIVGRRTFGKGGTELTTEIISTEKPKPSNLPLDFPKGQRPATLSSRAQPSADSKSHKTLSSSQKPMHSGSTSRKAKTSVPVLSMITDTSVGVDLRAARKSTSNAAAAAGSAASLTGEQGSQPTFMRPAGVDSPLPPVNPESMKRKRADSSSVTIREIRQSPRATDGTSVSVPGPGVDVNRRNGGDGEPARVKVKKTERKKQEMGAA